MKESNFKPMRSIREHLTANGFSKCGKCGAAAHWGSPCGAENPICGASTIHADETVSFCLYAAGHSGRHSWEVSGAADAH